MTNRVVVTGMGVMSALGQDVRTFWDNLIAGKSGVSRITSFDVSDYTTQIAAEVKDFDPLLYMDKKDVRRADRFVQFAIAATQKAMAQAELNMEQVDPDEVGVNIGSGIGGLSTFEDQHEILLTKGPRRVSPFFVPMLIADMAAGQVSIMIGAKGPNLSPISACATGSHSIGDAYRMIQRGDAQVMISGGAEATVRPMALAGFCSAKALSTRNDEPEKASRPFDLNRDGFVMGEGAGVLVLESLPHALKRNATILAEVIGYGMSGDAYHLTSPAPGGEGAAKAMKKALASADLSPEAIDYINAHGTSTDLNDKFETLAIKVAFGERAFDVPISSTKSMTGHLLGAAGGVEAIASIMALREQMIPPTINYETPDPDCDLDYVPNEARKATLTTALSNSFGFGGHNASLIFKRYSE